MFAKLNAFLRTKALGLYTKDEGATMVEYALMVALIAITCILVVQAVGTSVYTVFDKTQIELNKVPVAPTAPGGSAS